MPLKKKPTKKQVKALYLFTMIIFFFCFISGSVFLIVNVNELMKFNINPGPIPFATRMSLICGLFSLYCFRKIN
ncbi:hypothetical protein JCM19046_4321 [Bacillus sp. JCM 19046]|nr:hypothetical protein JCM19045_3233 [Bacillus sp. JCM 19045]GAF19655.1 hypothetical protein JCM19046_4321 [Bacillus sp. JCM 19046]